MYFMARRPHPLTNDLIAGQPTWKHSAAVYLENTEWILFVAAAADTCRSAAAGVSRSTGKRDRR
jgi:hypothetical protein